MLKMDTGLFVDVRNCLNPLASDRNPWRYTARELLGIAAYKAGRSAEARNYFQRLAADRAAPPGVSERAKLMLAVLSQEDQATAPPSATEKSEPEVKPASTKDQKGKASTAGKETK